MIMKSLGVGLLHGGWWFVAGAAALGYWYAGLPAIWATVGVLIAAAWAWLVIAWHLLVVRGLVQRTMLRRPLEATIVNEMATLNAKIVDELMQRRIALPVPPHAESWEIETKVVPDEDFWQQRAVRIHVTLTPPAGEPQ